MAFCSSATLNMLEGDEALTTAIGYSLNSTQPQSRRTRSMKGDNHFGGPASVDGFLRTGSVDGRYDK